MAKVRQRPYDERSAYARCYGEREGNVRVVKLEPKRPRYEPRVSGEDLRQRFAERLAEREPARDQEASAASGAVGSDGDAPSAVSA